MTRLKSHRPSAALVVATLALFVALGGGAYAVSKNSVGTKQLKSNSVTAKILKKNAVSSKILKKNAVKEAKIADGAVSSSKLGSESVRASKLGPIRQVTETTTIAEDTTGSATATCESSEKVIGGGQMTGLSTDNALFVQEDKRQDNGWRVGGLAQGDTVNLTTYAYCLEDNVNGNG
jgi:hypothetical protein